MLKGYDTYYTLARVRQRHRDKLRFYSIVLVGVFVFSCFDLVSTLFLMQRGAEEINPFMAAVMAYGDEAFAIVKLSLTMFGCAVIWLFIDEWIARAAAWALFAIYGTLCCWQIYLLYAYLSM